MWRHLGIRTEAHLERYRCGRVHVALSGALASLLLAFPDFHPGRLESWVEREQKMSASAPSNRDSTRRPYLAVKPGTLVAPGPS
jgi:hypothetical protein